MFFPVNIVREGFEFGEERFLAMPGRVERRSGTALRGMFLPKRNPCGKAAMESIPHFIRGQFKHYNIQYDPDQSADGGVAFLQNVLEEAKCDTVPAHIESLRREMRDEWFSNMTSSQLAEHYPEVLIERHFLDSSGNPDYTKTPEPIVVPLPEESESIRFALRSAIGHVPGLYYMASCLWKDHAFIMGWSQAAVAKAKWLIAEKARHREDQERHRREEQRIGIHNDFLDSRGVGRARPIGRYLVTCDIIEKEWPKYCQKDLALNVHTLLEHGILEADFSLGVLQGSMMLCPNKKKLGRRRGLVQYHGTDATDGEEEEDDGEEEHGGAETGVAGGGGDNGQEKQAGAEARVENGGGDNQVKQGEAEARVEDGGGGDNSQEKQGEAEAGTGTKRKATEPDRPAKKARLSSKYRKLFFRWYGLEAGEGDVFGPEPGRIVFDDDRLVSFTAKLDVEFIGRDIPFRGVKVSDIPEPESASWRDFL